ncbi:hypothetical protein HHL16_13210 [Pseudoflavitalea sp. G-6-1-2]|uniref:DUF6443 domain-containing protein n=1 Tax=Pseudoflavitalea sp. G-6-1-2 TaxID=2728841 RepID=UPI00146F3D7E|nr:DUF6443 domain-containing protein [Pseudoflavitalea sp. G-6-1-2]NML21843.1 hypothetical protein [Pseudoflavitalea sp. G-6-1-2]
MRILIVAILLLTCNSTFSQLLIKGPIVVPKGSQISYEVEGVPPSSLVSWGASPTVEIVGGQNSCQITWPNEYAVATIDVFEDLYGYSGSMTVLVGGPFITPFNQSIQYGESTVVLTANYGNYPATFLWQKKSASGQWENINGATNDSYLPALPDGYRDTYYRCIVTIYGENHITNEVLVEYAHFDPGSILLNSPVSFKSAPAISSIPASGGLCIFNQYQYVWEASVDGGPWEVIGNTQAYPATAPLIIGDTRIRRKATCQGQMLISNILEINPQYTYVDAENRNYIRTYTIHTKGIQSIYQANDLEIGKKTQKTNYLDGLGRTIQQVDKGISSSNGSWLDMVTPAAFDNQGRSPKGYLPYPSASQPGTFKTAVFTEQQQFYATNYNESSPWSLTGFENNPLNRIINQIDPGTNKQTNNLGISTDLSDAIVNKAIENVHIWKVGVEAGALPVTTATAVYADGKLRKTVLKDQEKKLVIQYFDLNGNLVMKKQQLADEEAGLSIAHEGWLCTYYVYDDFNRVRFIISPKAVKYLDGANWVINQSIVDELCFSYLYDGRGRVISKRIAGGGLEKYVYDIRNRLIFTQSANQAAKQVPEWSSFVFDEFNRQVMTGIYKFSGSQADLQTVADNSANMEIHYTQGTPVTGPLTVTTRTIQDAPSVYRSDVSIDFLPEFESLTGDEFTAEITGDGVPGGYTVYALGSYPVNVNDASVYTILSYQYYDKYNYPGVKPFDNTHTNTLAYAVTGDILPITHTDRTTGMVTGSKVRVLGSSQFLISTIYYDENGNISQTIGENIKNGSDIVTSQHSFDGKLMSEYTKHGAPGSPFNDFTLLKKNSYDKIGQLLAVEQKPGNSGFKKIASYQYDEFARTKNKEIGEKPGSAGTVLESLRYSYNAMGLLTGINKDYALTASSGSQWDSYFGIYLESENVDNRFAATRYDNLLTGVIWRSQGDNTPRKYDFKYDNAARLTGADFHQKANPADATWTNAAVDFSEKDITYDENGNLKQLNRMGIMPGTAAAVFIDKLQYTYMQVSGGEWSNKLLKVFDNNPGTGATANGLQGDFKDENFNVNANDYTYDANGNIVVDNNKKIREGSGNGIVFNHLNKPEKIVLENKSIVDFVYDATGNKLSKKVTKQGQTPVTTYYAGDFVYVENELEYYLHDEGRVRIMTPVSSTTPLGASAKINTGNVQLSTDKWGVYEYFVKDHQGSVRMVLSEESHKDIYSASMEINAASEEERLFGKVDNNGNPMHAGNELYDTRISKDLIPSWSSNTSGSVVKLVSTGGANGKCVGPNMLLKVMGGDFISAYSKYYYDLPVAPVNSQSILNSVVFSLLGGLSGNGVNQLVKNGADGIQAVLQDPVLSPLLPFMQNRPAPDVSRPKAYLNYMFFDENFNYVGEASGAKLISGNSNDNAVSALNIRVPKNGYAYVYLSNESDWPVYFDDFKVTHERSAIVEEKHYYPHGMKIAAISSKAFYRQQIRYGFQAEFSEEEEESGYNEFELRMYDPQTARWTGTDPFDQFASPYIGMGNNPANLLDPSGGAVDGLFAGLSLFKQTLVGATAGFIVGGTVGLMVDAKQPWNYAIGGALTGGLIAYAAGSFTVSAPSGDILTATANDQVSQQVGKLKIVMIRVHKYGKLVYEPIHDSYWGIIQTGDKILGGDARLGIDITHISFNGPVSYGYYRTETYSSINYKAPQFLPLPNPSIPAVQSNFRPLRVETGQMVPDPLEINFNGNSDQLTPTGNNVGLLQIRIIARIMTNNLNRSLTLTGNTGLDNPQGLPLRVIGPIARVNGPGVLNGRPSTIARIARARAETIRRIFINRYGINGNRITTQAGNQYNDPAGRKVESVLR